MTTALPPVAGALRPAATRWQVIGHLSPTARILIASRAVRSLGQGALAVDFALYLAALHWNAVQMGGVYMGALSSARG